MGVRLPTEDQIGRFVLSAVFFVFALAALGRLALLFDDPMPGDEQWALDVVTRLTSYIFMMLVVATTVMRLPARRTAEGIEPRLSAIIGSFAILTLVVLPTGDLGVTAKFIGTALVLTGTALSVYCLAWLGRSFSVMAHARRLVTRGPYAVVRHPLYGAEMVTLAGLGISNYSPAALAVIALTVAFQFRRMYNEECVLRAEFPEYGAYAGSVPLIIPGFAGFGAGSQAD